jgi:hypothetical protein
MQSISTILNMVLAIGKIVLFFFKRNALKEAEIHAMENALKQWGIESSDDPRIIRETYENQKARIKDFFKKNSQ